MRQFAEAGDLSGLIRDALGAGSRVAAVERLRGGTRKGVYRVRLDGTPLASVIVYSWSDEENFWPGTQAAPPADVLAASSGLDPFLAAHQCLDALGVRVPRLLLADRTRRRHPADVAVAEDITGGSLEELLAADPAAATGVLADLADMLDAMHRHHSPHYGKVHVLDEGDPPPDVPSEQRILDGALRDVEEAGKRDPRIAAAAPALEDRLHELAQRVRPRSEFGLIHGELGPDHVLIDDEDRPVLIDIEGLKHFDVEWEHVYLRLRFADRYTALARPGLDPRRLDLYALAMHLSNVAGPLRLLDGDFPDRDGMRAIVEHNLKSALALLPPEAR
jgi:hypothetical protein